MGKSIGSFAGYLAAAAYAVAAGLTVWGSIVADPDRDGEGMSAALPYVVWTVLILVGTIGAAVVVGALRRREAPSGALGKVALGFAVAAAVTSSLAWAWFLWGGLLSVAFLLLALALRRNGTGVTGGPSAWDWAIPVAAPLGLIIAAALYASGVFGEAVDGDSNWPGTIMFVVMLGLYAATLALAGRHLRAFEPVTGKVSAQVA